MFLLRIIRKIRGIGHRYGFGVQSPFAYHFITMLSKQQKVNFFHHSNEESIITTIRNLQESGIRNQTSNIVNQQLPVGHQTPMCLVADIVNKSEVEQMLTALNEDTLLIIKHPYRNKDAYRYWKEIILRENVRMSFDFYSVGVIFMRKGLSKKHYIVNL